MPQFDDDTIMRGQGRERAADLLASFANLLHGLRAGSMVGVPFIVQLGCDLLPFEVIEA